MKKNLKFVAAMAGALVMLTALQVQAESKSAHNAIEIYPPHAAPDDMTMMEQALHRRATEIAIWSMPLMNYKAMYDSLHEAVGMNYNGDVGYHSEIQLETRVGDA